MVEAIVAIKEEKIPETIDEIEVEVSSALESLVKNEPSEDSRKTTFANVSTDGHLEITPKQYGSSQDDSFPVQEYFGPKDAQKIFDYDYSSDEPSSFYDSTNERESEIKEEVAEEIKSQKIANTWNVQGEQKGDPSLAKKAAQEFYKMINFTMNTVLYDLAEA